MILAGLWRLFHSGHIGQGLENTLLMPKFILVKGVALR